MNFVKGLYVIDFGEGFVFLWIVCDLFFDCSDIGGSILLVNV